MFLIIGLVANIFMAFFVYRFFFLRFSLFNHNSYLLHGLRVFSFLMGIALPLSFLFGRTFYIPTLSFAFNALFGLCFLLFICAFPIFFLLPAFVRLPNKWRLLLEKGEAYYLAASIFFVISSFAMGLLPPSVVHTSIHLPNLPMERLKVVQLSDMHLGPILRTTFARQVVEQVNLLRPDLIVITGDLVDQKTKNLLEPLAELAHLKARLGVYFCLGNHEYYANDIANLLAQLKQLGITPLVNEGRQIGDGEQKINLIAIADKMGSRFQDYRPDMPATLSSIDDRFPTILLSHHPIDPASLEKKVDLILSGHTHGGQVMPFDIPVMMVHRFLEGLYQVKDGSLYVNRGTGFWGPPIRFPAGGEISELVLLRTKL